MSCLVWVVATIGQIILLLSQQVSHCLCLKQREHTWLSVIQHPSGVAQWMTFVQSQCFTIRKKKWISLGLEIFMEMSYLVWCLGIFDLVSKIIWITCVTDTSTAPKDGPSERPEGGNLGTTFKEKPKRKAWKACPTAVPHITPVLPPYMAPTTG